MHGEQVGDDLVDQGMPADLFGCDGLSLKQRGDRFADLTALRMCAGHVDEHPGLPLS